MEQLLDYSDVSDRSRALQGYDLDLAYDLADLVSPVNPSDHGESEQVKMGFGLHRCTRGNDADGLRK